MIRLKMTCITTVMVLACAAPGLMAETPRGTPGFKHCGLYLHACWLYNYPLATRTWNRRDYRHMFRLLEALGYDRVMLWPMMEAIPRPLSAEDAQALRDYSKIVEDARRAGLECWLAQSVCTTDRKIAKKPWPNRNFYAVRQDVRLDRPAQAGPWLDHEAAMLAILNNADAYVTIDSDPGGYPGAKAEDFVKLLKHDRRTIDRVGVRPKQQKVMPWVWGGWGMQGWEEPVAARVARLARELEMYRAAMADGWEVMPGRNGGEYGCGRFNMGLVERAGLMPRATLMLYDSIENEPSPPATKLHFDEIRYALRQELQYAAVARGCFGNCQTAILELPNLYFFVRSARDPRYLEKPDGAVLADLAEFLGGPPELLVPAWSCLRLGLAQLPADLPAKLRRAELTAEAAQYIPGGPRLYLRILAAEVDSHRRLLQACHGPAESEAEAARRTADGVKAVVDWWKLHGYTLDRDEKSFAWEYVWSGDSGTLFHWMRGNRQWPDVARLAAQRIAQEGTLLANVAQARVDQAMGLSAR